MDIIRNISVRETCGSGENPPEGGKNPLDMKITRYSLPNINFKDTKMVDEQQQKKQQIPQQPPVSQSNRQNENSSNYDSNRAAVAAAPKQMKAVIYERGRCFTMSEPQEDECAVSGRLEIRVVPQEQSPNPDESVYFDAIAANGGGIGGSVTTAVSAASGVNVGAAGNPCSRTVNIRSDIIEIKQANSNKGDASSAPPTPPSINDDILKCHIGSASSLHKNVLNNGNEANAAVAAFYVQKIINLNNENNEDDGDDAVVVAGTATDASITTDIYNNVKIGIKEQTEFPVDRQLSGSKYDEKQQQHLQFPPMKQLSYTALTDSISSQGAYPARKVTAGAQSQSSSIDCNAGTAAAAAVAAGAAVKRDNQQYGASAATSGSKIPIFNQSLRISKCASWAGGDCTNSPDMQDLTPGKGFFLLLIIYYTIFFSVDVYK